MHHCAVDADTITRRQVEARDGCSAGGNESGHGESDAGVHAHAFIDAGFEVGEFDGLSVGYGDGEGAVGDGGVDFGGEFGVGGGV